MKLKGVIEDPICGEGKKIRYDQKTMSLDVELVRVLLGEDDDEGHYEIVFCDGSGKGEEFFRLHIKEAIELKSIIDNLVFDSVIDMNENNKGVDE